MSFLLKFASPPSPLPQPLLLFAAPPPTLHPSEQLLTLLSDTLMPQSYAADTLNTILTLQLPGGARFPCSSPSYIPCPPLVKWRGHYTAGRAPFCRTASLGVSLSIARAGRSVVLQCVQACLCPWATAANKFTAAHCQWDTYSGFFFLSHGSLKSTRTWTIRIGAKNGGCLFSLTSLHGWADWSRALEGKKALNWREKEIGDSRKRVRVSLKKNPEDQRDDDTRW